MSDCSIIVFAKAPVPGQVKTRLAESLGASGAARLYERLAFRTLQISFNSGVGPVALWCAPAADHPFFKRCADHFKMELRTQPQGDLGRRMAGAFQETLNGVTAVLLIGTDCPSLTEDDLREAALAVEKGADAVIGPTEDGGYVLMGLRTLASPLFDSVPWGTEKVLAKTRHRLRKLGWRWHELPVRWDVDRPEDVKRMIAEGYSTMVPDDSPGIIAPRGDFL